MVLTDNDAARVLAHLPRVQQAFEDVHRRARSAVEPDLLQLCEQRICQLLGAAVSVATTNDVASSALGTAALVFVEQWVIDVAGITDAMVSVLVDELGHDALMDFIHGVLAVEQRVRLGLAWQQLGLIA